MNTTFFRGDYHTISKAEKLSSLEEFLDINLEHPKINAEFDLLIATERRDLLKEIVGFEKITHKLRQKILKSGNWSLLTGEKVLIRSKKIGAQELIDHLFVKRSKELQGVVWSLWLNVHVFKHDLLDSVKNLAEDELVMSFLFNEIIMQCKRTKLTKETSKKLSCLKSLLTISGLMGPDWRNLANKHWQLVRMKMVDGDPDNEKYWTKMMDRVEARAFVGLSGKTGKKTIDPFLDILAGLEYENVSISKDH